MSFINTVRNLYSGVAFYLVPERKWSFLSIPASNKNFNPQNTSSIPPVKILIFPDLNKKPSFSIRHYLCISLLLFSIFTSSVFSERIFFAGYNGGFYIKSEEKGGMELKLGGAFQSDYRYYNESQRADNRFDIRRARLKFSGRLTRWARFMTWR